MKVAALDLGTNTFLCLVVEGDRSGIKNILSDQAEVVRLGQGVDQTKQFHPDALLRAKNCLARFKTEIDRWGVDRILAMATSAARDVKNAEKLFDIGRELGIPIEIIPGADEARITFKGATVGELVADDPVLVIDVGGGSTELIVGNADKILFSTSLDIGAVRLTEKFITTQPISGLERKGLEDHVTLHVERIYRQLSQYKFTKVLAVAGTPSSLAAASLGGYQQDKIHGYSLDLAALKNWCEVLSQATSQDKISKYHIEPGRADVIFAGATILYRVLERVQKPSMMVSIKGVRYGVALEALSRDA